MKAIDLEEAIARFIQAGQNMSKDQVIYMLNRIPTTEIVRCKDCRHAYYADNRVPHERTWVCERFTNEEINANDFCSFGERSEE